VLAEEVRSRCEPATPARINRRRRDAYAIAHYGTPLRSPADTVKYAKDPYKRARAMGYRSGLEVKIAAELSSAGIKVEYEAVVLKYVAPAKIRRYTPDFVLPSGIIIETKGQFVTEDRTKHRLLREQYPALDLRFVFSNPNAKIGSKSTTTYAMWCDRLGIKWAKGSIPAAWLSEKPNKKSIAEIDRLRSGIDFTPPL
jgi:hypothetical protein